MQTTNLIHRIAYMLATFLLFLPFTTFAQEAPIDATDVTRITLLTPGVSREFRVGKKQTIHTALLTNVIIQSVISSTFSETNVYVDPAATAGYRYYYNLNRRQERGKRYEKNSGNYVSAFSALVFTKARMASDHYEERSRRAIGSFGTCWGMQRNYRGHFSLDLNVGIQYEFGKATIPSPFTNDITRKVTGRLLGAVNITLGIWLN